MESKWFVRILALILTLLLYVTAYIENKGIDALLAGDSIVTETIEDVPVQVYYDEDLFVVSNVPLTADVIVQGKSSLVRSTKNLRDFTVFIDLTDAEIGEQRVKLQVEGISDKLSVRIDPAWVTVNVQEKISKEFSVEVEFNKNLLDDGYVAEQPIVDPATVTVTGGKDVISQISYVKAMVEVDGPITSTFTQSAAVSVLDKNLNKLSVEVKPNRVDVTIPVISPKKTVPITINPVGDPKEGFSIKSIEPVIREVVIYGKQSVLDEISDIKLDVNVAGIDENKEVTVPIKLPDGVRGATPEEVTVKIIVDRITSRTIGNISIQPKNMAAPLEVHFLDPQNGQVSLEVSGPSETVQNLGSSSFQATIDLEGLGPGVHEVPLVVNGPDGIQWKLNQKTAKVQLTERKG